jgi:divalent metal cation (Fe/Co/Zn/Cd) transporter
VVSVSAIDGHRRAALGCERSHSCAALSIRWWEDAGVVEAESSSERSRLMRRGVLLEQVTLGWNVVGVVVLIVAAWWASSVALVGFGLDSVIEIGASAVVLWELSGEDDQRGQRALRMIGGAFVALGVYLLVQATVVLVVGHRAGHSRVGIGWTAATALVMIVLAASKSRTGRALANPVLVAEGRVTLIDAVLATAVLVGLCANALAGWWWADPAAGLVVVFYAAREARHLLAPVGLATAADRELRY